ncbi:hypothetical protein F441_17572 [Phytophthora nicotianae CJ01A1]|uniref:Uncharacterized protein n=3 Tax=Phytophthora nicotianae TaxID=4792 RepID=W2W687_PHYNI|nr:hypothetical protein L916_17126 [Phytophthora nicotianae]ETO64859.1 hypothetical protein F444_17737 [Phytophthora nicotianae P1976]ETP05966.1 hypothetical protein F441_17572 [Phytophthora nicotianae CJ01A1]
MHLRSDEERLYRKCYSHILLLANSCRCHFHDKAVIALASYRQDSCVDESNLHSKKHKKGWINAAKSNSPLITPLVVRSTRLLSLLLSIVERWGRRRSTARHLVVSWLLRLTIRHTWWCLGLTVRCSWWLRLAVRCTCCLRVLLIRSVWRVRRQVVRTVLRRLRRLVVATSRNLSLRYRHSAVWRHGRLRHSVASGRRVVRVAVRHRSHPTKTTRLRVFRHSTVRLCLHRRHRRHRRLLGIAAARRILSRVIVCKVSSTSTASSASTTISTSAV